MRKVMLELCIALTERPIDWATVIGAQRTLNSLKVVEPPLIEDEINGAKTRAAIRAFQRANGLEADAVIGEETTTAMAKALEQQVEPRVSSTLTCQLAGFFNCTSK